MFLPWPEEKDIKVYANETQQALATINRCLIRLLDNDKFLYHAVSLHTGDVLNSDQLTGDVRMANKYLSIYVDGPPGDPAMSGTFNFLLPLYTYDE